MRQRGTLGRFVNHGHRQFWYFYDFGDYWQHTPEMESAFQPEEGTMFPLCLEGTGSCPPKDVGGSMGYEVFLEVINDPEHDRRKDYLDWCGGWFNPEAFDVEIVNRVLGKRRTV